MKKDRLDRWVRNIYETQEQEISCSECFDQVSHFVEMELADEDSARKLPLLKQHLDQCPACREEYETLRDLARLEQEGQLPSLGDLEDQIS